MAPLSSVMSRARPQYLKLWVRGSLFLETCHDGCENSVARSFAGSGGPHQRASETDVENVKQLDDLADE